MLNFWKNQVYIDFCQLRIKCHLVSKMARTSEMISALEGTVLAEFLNLHIPNLEIRSDNGSQLRERRYEEYVMALKISHYTIHADTPEKDEHVESYFGHFKEDYIYKSEFSSFDEFSGYMKWEMKEYNSLRPHLSLNYLIPEEFECKVRDDSMFKDNWVEKQMDGYEHVTLLQ